MTMTSGEMLLPSDTDFSRFCLTLRSSASSSGGSSSLGAGSSRRVILALRYGSVCDEVESSRARDRPWTRMRMRPSGSFSIRMIAATVPTRVEVLRPRRVVLRVLLGDEHDDPLLGEGVRRRR